MSPASQFLTIRSWNLSRNQEAEFKGLPLDPNRFQPVPCEAGEPVPSVLVLLGQTERRSRPISLRLRPGKDFLRAAQMNMNLATWGRLMMSVLPPCSSLEPLSPPLAAPSSTCTPPPTGPAG